MAMRTRIFFGNLYCCLFTAGPISVVYLNTLHDLIQLPFGLLAIRYKEVYFNIFSLCLI